MIFCSHFENRLKNASNIRRFVLILKITSKTGADFVPILKIASKTRATFGDFVPILKITSKRRAMFGDFVPILKIISKRRALILAVNFSVMSAGVLRCALAKLWIFTGLFTASFDSEILPKFWKSPQKLEILPEF